MSSYVSNDPDDDYEDWENKALDLCQNQKRPVKPTAGTEYTDSNEFETKIRLGGTEIASATGDSPEESEREAWRVAYLRLQASGAPPKANTAASLTSIAPSDKDEPYYNPGPRPTRQPSATAPRYSQQTSYADFRNMLLQTQEAEKEENFSLSAHKNVLQELLQRHNLPLPEYFSTSQGESHNPRFACKVKASGKYYASKGVHPKKGLAEQDAALEALKVLKPALDGVPYTESGESEDNSDMSRYKNLLQEYLQSMGYGTPEYSGTSKGLSHMIHWWADVYIPGIDQTFSTYPDTYPTKKQAEFEVAKLALESLKNPTLAMPKKVTSHPGKDQAAALASKLNVPAPVFHPDESRTEKLANAKQKLQDYCFQKALTLPVYDSRSFGSPHIPQWITTVKLGTRNFQTPTSFPSKKLSEQESALLTLMTLEAEQENLKKEQLIKLVRHTPTQPPAQPQQYYQPPGTPQRVVQVNPDPFPTSGRPQARADTTGNVVTVNMLTAADPNVGIPPQVVAMAKEHSTPPPSRAASEPKDDAVTRGMLEILKVGSPHTPPVPPSPTASSASNSVSLDELKRSERLNSMSEEAKLLLEGAISGFKIGTDKASIDDKYDWLEFLAETLQVAVRRIERLKKQPQR